MHRKEFLQRICDKYQGYFKSPEHFNAWAEDYKLILPEDCDYTEINRKIVLTFSDMYKPPSPAEINKIIQDINLEKHQEAKKFKPIERNGVDPNTVPEILELKKKLGLVSI